jgi:hypothetical protein
MRGESRLTRGQLEATEREFLKKGAWYKADLVVADFGEGPVVVKDFAAKSLPVRLLGRLQVSRELRAYRFLGRIPGIPALVGRVDAHAIAIEKIEGRQLGFMPDMTDDGAAKLAQLRRIMDSMHAVGVVHWDLRARQNVLLTPDGELFVIDFASAMRLKPGSLVHRLFFPLMSWIDETAYLKWKGILEAGPYTDEELAMLRRARFWRRLWLFNRKDGMIPRGGGDEL